jgi:hypothetical protein
MTFLKIKRWHLLSPFLENSVFPGGIIALAMLSQQNSPKMPRSGAHYFGGHVLAFSQP